jgi:hypothetical protein
MCKHVVGMAIRFDYCKPPSAAKNVPIGEKDVVAHHPKPKKLYLFNKVLLIILKLFLLIEINKILTK